jgi:hypothetical protein
MPKTGVDDYLAGGGTIAELKLMARPYKPEDLAGARLSRDDKLRAGLDELERKWRGHTWKTQGDYTARSIMRVLIRAAEKRGKVVDDGIRVVMAKRTLALEAAVSTRAPTRAIPRLEAAGLLRRDNEGRKRDKAGAFVLLTGGAHQCPHNREREAPAKKADSLFIGPYNRRGDTSARPDVPELRWSTVLIRREWDKRGRSHEVRDHLARLGKKRGAIVEHLLEYGTDTEAELLEAFGGPRTRLRDFRRRTLGPLLIARIVALEGGAVTLTDDWREALEDDRERAGEITAARLQAQRYARQREAFRGRHERPAGRVPEMRPIPDLRKPWPVHPDGCACPACVERFGAPDGDHPDDCKCAPCFSARKDEERDRAHEEGRRVVPIAPHRRRSPRPSRPVEEAGDRPADDWRSHPLTCECLDCAATLPKYARVRELA